MISVRADDEPISSGRTSAYLRCPTARDGQSNTPLALPTYTTVREAHTFQTLNSFYLQGHPTFSCPSPCQHTSEYAGEARLTPRHISFPLLISLQPNGKQNPPHFHNSFQRNQYPLVDLFLDWRISENRSNTPFDSWGPVSIILVVNWKILFILARFVPLKYSFTRRISQLPQLR